MQNKGIYFLFSLIVIVFVFLVSFDAYMKFSYENTHNNTTNVSVPQIIPSIPSPIMNVIVLIVGAFIMLGLFYGIANHLLNR